MLSEACPLQKHSSHYNKIKGNLEEARIPPRSFKNVLKPEKMNCGIVFSIPPFSAPALPLHSHILLQVPLKTVPANGPPQHPWVWMTLMFYIFRVDDCWAQVFVCKSLFFF